MLPDGGLSMKQIVTLPRIFVPEGDSRSKATHSLPLDDDDKNEPVWPT
jgi:hypothetical protein